MDHREASRRDATLRAFFDGKDWDKNEEFVLKRELVRRSFELLPGYPLLVEDEWDVVSGMTNHGRGDLVFTDGSGRFAIVETKYIDCSRSGATARAKRTDSRGKVWEQAQRYAMLHRLRDGVEDVTAWYYTNERADALVPVPTPPPVDLHFGGQEEQP
jgi:hypothetical protein